MSRVSENAVQVVWRRGSRNAPRKRLPTRHMQGPRFPGVMNAGAELLALKGHTDAVRSASFSADGARIVTGSTD